MRVIWYLLLALLAIVLVTVALANAAPVTLYLLPPVLAGFLGIAWEITLPLFVVILLSVAIGLLLGFVWEWAREHHHRVEARRQRRERERLEGYPDWFLVHDHVADYNEPLYVSQFIDRARQHQLRFLAEADFHSMHPHGMAPWVAEMLRQADTPEMREQYLDFFRGRTFRRTLLCRAECIPDPFAEAALGVFEKSWPQRIPFAELGRRMKTGPTEEATLEQFVFDLYRDGFLDLHTYMPELTTQVSEYPVASPLARLQVQRDTLVTSLLHRNVVVEDANARNILALLDGKHSVHDLVRAMPEQLPQKRGFIQEALHFFARSGLLMA